MFNKAVNLAPIFAASGKAVTWEAVLISIVVAIIFIAIWALLIMILWNLTLPGIFGWPCISFWQALGLGLLIGLLF